ncbi:Leucine-rich_repeat [Hexamita inflata]|uniref:Leucine-rich repeat n=1 Tax=Hexamita inflata TaxID=28002 RepID=A0AA86N5E7_9EUKA|nr:Leucine-rich repeat [Hexamita inflata]CAI9914853.1 Leucine-rich repeat [Hexamita inflata]
MTTDFLYIYNDQELRYNQIVELNIRGLDKLKGLNIRSNKIRDLSGAEYLKAKGCCCITTLMDKRSRVKRKSTKRGCGREINK